MIDRILKNWKTTVLGLAILITCFILVFMEKSTLTEVSVFICGGFFVLFSKDSMLRKKGPVSVIIFGSLLLFASCRPYRSFTTNTERIVRDTITIRDSIPFRIEIPGDTVRITSDSIVYDTVCLDQLQSGRFSLPPWETSTKFAYATAGITNSVPWLNLRQNPINIDTLIYINKIKILERTIREMESRIIVPEKDPFYKNVWLWISVMLGIVLFRRYARN